MKFKIGDQIRIPPQSIQDFNRCVYIKFEFQSNGIHKISNKKININDINTPFRIDEINEEWCMDKANKNSQIHSIYLISSSTTYKAYMVDADFIDTYATSFCNIEDWFD